MWQLVEMCNTRVISISETAGGKKREKEHERERDRVKRMNDRGRQQGRKKEQ